MVKKKNDNWIAEWMKEERLKSEERRKREVVAVRWYVYEHQPAHRWSDEYDSYWENAKSTIVSPYFDTEDEAWDWYGEHEPDKGNSLHVASQNKRRWTEVREEWVNY